MIRIASASVTTAMAVPLSDRLFLKPPDRLFLKPESGRLGRRGRPHVRREPTFNGQRPLGFRRTYLLEAREAESLRSWLVVPTATRSW